MPDDPVAVGRAPADHFDAAAFCIESNGDLFERSAIVAWGMCHGVLPGCKNIFGVNLGMPRMNPVQHVNHSVSLR